MKSIKVKTNDLLEEIIVLLKQDQIVEFIVTGNSMLPFYKHEKTIVTLKQQSSYKKHDVVLFKYKHQFVLHRIIKIKGDDYILRGDGAFRKEYVTKEHIYGKVISFTSPKGMIKAYKFKYKLWLLFTPFRRILLKFVRK